MLYSPASLPRIICMIPLPWWKLWHHPTFFSFSRSYIVYKVETARLHGCRNHEVTWLQKPASLQGQGEHVSLRRESVHKLAVPSLKCLGVKVFWAFWNICTDIVRDSGHETQNPHPGFIYASYLLCAHTPRIMLCSTLSYGRGMEFHGVASHGRHCSCAQNGLGFEVSKILELQVAGAPPLPTNLVQKLLEQVLPFLFGIILNVGVLDFFLIIRLIRNTV